MAVENIWFKQMHAWLPYYRFWRVLSGGIFEVTVVIFLPVVFGRVIKMLASLLKLGDAIWQKQTFFMGIFSP